MIKILDGRSRFGRGRGGEPGGMLIRNDKDRARDRPAVSIGPRRTPHHLRRPDEPAPLLALCTSMTTSFTPAERDLIRRTFGAGWGEPPPLSAGIWLHRWASGPHKGRPKLGKVVQGLLDRGLVTIDDAGHWPVARFTAAGLEALRAMAADARQLDPTRFGHLIEELRRH